MATETPKKWDGGRSSRGTGEKSGVVLGSGGVTLGKLFENMGANLCNLGTTNHEKWDGK